MSEPVTIERVERGLVILAYLIELDGPVLAPLFERLERELAAMRQTRRAGDGTSLMAWRTLSPPARRAEHPSAAYPQLRAQESA